jgi:ATP-dependent Clp protease ATP-binding subunit ClpC
MFERHTDEARRAIVFARIDASHFGSPVIETEHLLLGILRENLALVNRFLSSQASKDSIRSQVQDRAVIRRGIPASSAEISFSDGCNHVLSFATEEADLMDCECVGIEHLLLGILREESCVAAQILRERGASIERARKELMTAPHQPPPKSVRIRRGFDQIRKLLTDAGAPPGK